MPESALRLAFRLDGARTVLDVHEQQPPWKIVRAFEKAHGESLVHLHNVSGGVLGGDRLGLHVDLAEGARVLLTTTGATRIYRSRANAVPASQSTHIRIARDALLEYLPDPVIPFAGSRFEQRTCISLMPGAGLFWWETIAPGREASGERFLYNGLKNFVDIRAGEKPIALERILLEPKLRNPHSPLRLGPFSYFTSFYICHTGEAAARWQELESALSETVAAISTDEVRWGVSTLAAHGLVVRGVSTKARHLPPGLLKFWRAAKQFLYGHDAVLPRKLY